MLQRKVKKMVTKSRTRTEAMRGQELLHFPEMAPESWDEFPRTQLQPEYT